MKNIQYRISDKRYIGRKQIKNKIITVYGKTQKDCYNKLNLRIKEILTPRNINKTPKFLLGDVFQKWYKEEKEPFISQGTKNDIKLVYKQLKPLYNSNIKRLSKQDLIQFFSKLEDNRTKEKTRLYLNACLKYLQNEGLLQINPCANIKVKQLHNKKSAFTYEQQCKILENANKNLKPIIIIYLITGLRKNELNFSSIEKDIDFENKILKAINLKGRNLVKRFKYIQLSQQALVFIMNNIDKIHNYNAETAYRDFSKLLKTLKISGSIVNLRHTFATNCFYLGKQDLIISREMGHSRTQITKDIYTDIDYHLSKEKILKLYNNLYNIF